ncbi:hypothetical protein OH733_05330 [Streptomyces griseus]|uniref:hypothetical protein n=1 Tax=Streptomyces griseus TaxID=1911 RepID=UPI00386BC7A0|nr:hypothetical protein OH733_05330 [Streptomyces griseus]WTD71185.1 hypothetical protein OH763_31655 [Streptomyces griseus]
MSEYAFDATLMSVIRVQAESESEAEEIARSLIAVDVMASIDGGSTLLTEISVETVDLFEVDGEYEL